MAELYSEVKLFATQAVKSDIEGNYDKAYELYQKSISGLIELQKTTTDPELCNIYNEKEREYHHRAEILQKRESYIHAQSLARQAVENEMEWNYTKAHNLYLQSTKILVKLIDKTQDKKLQSIYYEKVFEYRQRASILRISMNDSFFRLKIWIRKTKRKIILKLINFLQKLL